MKCLRTLGVLLVTLSLVWSKALETTSPRYTTTSDPANITSSNARNEFLDTKVSNLDILDVRTPPKVQNQIKDKLSSKYSIEASHAGVAIPVVEDLETLEESTKKMNFYKLERPTTANGGLSTWILLSGQTSATSPKPTTNKTSVKPIIMKDEKNNETLMLSEKPMKIIKPAFKPRSTTPKTVISSLKTTSSIKANTFSSSTTKKPTKLTKVKASSLHFNKNRIAANTTTSTTSGTDNSAAITTKAPVPNTAMVKLASATESSNMTTTTFASSSLPVEAKDTEQELPEIKRKKTQKKNKNKRRKPDKASKTGNTKLKEIESSGTQLYSYLRSEIIPVTVGVSLVGLLVTAGLASYYLQPFAALRRSDPIERKDTEGTYYYQDEYSNAMPEEEAIGKVIAGMPENALQGNSNYKQPTSRNTYSQNVRYRQVDRRSQIYMNPYGSVEDVKLTDEDSSNLNTDKNIVVGNHPEAANDVPDVTPAVIPEHGPRNLNDNKSKFVVGNIPKEFFNIGASPRNIKIRKRRDVTPNDIENEIVPLEDNELIPNTTIPTSSEDLNDVTEQMTTEDTFRETTPHNVYNPKERPNTLFELLTDLFKLKIKLGFELLQNVTNSVSSYVRKVHTKLDQHYRKVAKGNGTIYLT